jgi:dTDP-4-amino-4,6-dideoxy-D-galactose acyltransferase
MSEPYQYLNWDSEFFGLRIAKLNKSQLNFATMAETLSWCVQNSIDCLYFLADSNDQATIRIAEDNHFRLVDLRMSMRCQIDSNTVSPQPNYDFTIRPVETQDINRLRSIARSSFTLTRFYSDSCFPREKCDELYDVWITRSCQGYADQVLVAIHNGVPHGFISLHLKSEVGEIGIIGVSRKTRRVGIGRALVESALYWYHSVGIRQVIVATQGKNYRAQNFFQHNGFDVHNMHIWYHKWFSGCSKDGNS